MARQTLVVDASVGVKWFSAIGESHVLQARTILLDHSSGELAIIVPDIFFHEVANALVHKASVSGEELMQAMTDLFDLDLAVFASNAERLRSTAQVARKAGISEYDTCYGIIAVDAGCPLVTANPCHRGRDLGCRVIPIEDLPGQSA